MAYLLQSSESSIVLLSRRTCLCSSMFSGAKNIRKHWFTQMVFVCVLIILPKSPHRGTALRLQESLTNVPEMTLMSHSQKENAIYQNCNQTRIILSLETPRCCSCSHSKSVRLHLKLCWKIHPKSPKSQKIAPGHVETAISRALSKRIITGCLAKTLLFPST